jgi:hypothetical protein
MPTDLTVILEHRPGELARLGEIAGEAGVTIHGLAAFTGEGRGVVHMLLDDEAVAGCRAALERAGMGIADERKVFVIDVEDRPAALGELTRRLAEANVNVDLAYTTFTGGKIVIATDEWEALAPYSGRSHHAASGIPAGRLPAGRQNVSPLPVRPHGCGVKDRPSGAYHYRPLTGAREGHHQASVTVSASTDRQFSRGEVWTAAKTIAPYRSAGRRAFLLSFVITQRDPDCRSSPMRRLARVSGRVVWPGKCSYSAGQLPATRGQYSCSCAVSAVKQAPRGCRHELGGRGAECFQGGGQRPARPRGTARGSGRRRPGHGHRFPPPGAADRARLFVAAPVPACNLHVLQPTALA